MAFAAILVALLVVAIAVAQPGDGDEASPETSATQAATPTPTGEETEQPSAAPTAPPTDEATPPVITDAPESTVPAAGDDNEADTTESSEEEGESAVGTTIATNPGGHCVDLPNDSDVVLHPDKHPNWTVGTCDPGQVPGPDGDPPDNGGHENGGPPEGRTPSLNPDGVCVALPNNSDIVQNPDKHPNWVVGGCDTPSE